MPATATRQSRSRRADLVSHVNRSKFQRHRGEKDTMRSLGQQRLRLMGLAVLALAAILLVADCGGVDSSSSSAATEATEEPAETTEEGTGEGEEEGGETSNA